METQSFTARRSAASNLPNFQLPSPDPLSGSHKYSAAYVPTSSSQPVPPVSSVLTPPATLPSGDSPLSSLNSVSSGNSASAPPYQQPMGFWPTPNNQNPSYSYSSSAPHAQASNYIRPMYSPSYPPQQNRNGNPPAAAEGMGGPPYDGSLPAFPPAMGSSSGQPQNHSLATQHQHQLQHQQQRSQPQASPPPPPQQMNNGIVNSLPSSQAPHQAPTRAPEFGGRPPLTPSYYTPSSTPQQPSFPAYTQQSPRLRSPPNVTSASANRISPVSTPQHQGYHGRPYSGYNLPAMNGPIMSNMHSPGNQMAIVGGMSMSYPPHQMGGPMYGHHSAQPQPPNDRPFKCDLCPQSFNRNHDLKRHKRIHLAVKPFPCGYCEKSFSRKDALKRHGMVKGCGKDPSNAAANTGDRNQSPGDKPEVRRDSSENRSTETNKANQ
ncbi:hypothetical protein BJ875DRAFT_243459 [Amylocarpus encephaloides]|uniref:C2H2-type domain-containing protein n=1 Tax=Amylocarpus encephaloides TaxID=45428 RepID=A0A9P7YSV4_9HELO|nr:hypothetical protein BJ875DRAFT_243459 [Amylocarpus encephaloides]